MPDLWAIHRVTSDDGYDTYVARRITIDVEVRPTRDIRSSNDLDELRARFYRAGLVRMPRSATDAEDIIESWL